MIAASGRRWGRAAPVADTLRNPTLRSAVAAYLCATVSEWALWVGVLVHAYERGGPAWAGFASLGLLVPAALAAPLAGAAADGARPNRVLTRVAAVQALALAGATGTALGGAHIGVTVALVAVSVTATTFVRPTCSVVLPGLVARARELTAANVLIGWADGTAALAGPLLASAMLAVAGTPGVFASCAGLSLVSAVATLPLLRLDRRRARESAALASAAGSRHRTRAGARAWSLCALGSVVAGVRSQRGVPALLVVLTGHYVLIGALDILYVVIALDVLELGESGAGVLAATFGAGAVAGSALTAALVARRTLAPVLLGGLAVISAAMLALGMATTLAVAVATFVGAGIAWSVVDVTGRMLMQRAARQDVLAATFAALEALAGVGVVVGSVLAQVAVAVSGAPAALAAVGACFAVLLAVTAGSLREVDAVADAPVVAIRLLRGIPMFAALPPPAIEGVARAATERRVGVGTVIVAEGEPGNGYCAIGSGEVTVTVGGRYVRTLGRGSGFGEIALLADVPRTASVTAATDVSLLEVERVAFLTAVTGHDTSASAAWAAAGSLRPDLVPDGQSASAGLVAE